MLSSSLPEFLVSLEKLNEGFSEELQVMYPEVMQQLQRRLKKHLLVRHTAWGWGVTPPQYVIDRPVDVVEVEQAFRLVELNESLSHRSLVCVASRSNDPQQEAHKVADSRRSRHALARETGRVKHYKQLHSMDIIPGLCHVESLFFVTFQSLCFHLVLAFANGSFTIVNIYLLVQRTN